MTIIHHFELIQHSDEWRQARCGLLTASEMDLIVTPAKLEVANNEKMRNHLCELAAQRITQYVEPTWFGGDMERGIIDEIDAKQLYRTHYAAVEDCGFITNDRWGFKLGCSPDGLVGTDGGIEIKSRAQKYQLETISNDTMPRDFLIQVQSTLLITEREWWDFISYCSGMPMYTKRIYADEPVQKAILQAAHVFHTALDARLKIWNDRINDKNIRLIPTERKIMAEDIAA